LPQTDARFEQQLANRQEAFEQQLAANSWGAGSEQRLVTNSWEGDSEQQVVAANSWEAGSEQRLGKNSWERESEQRSVVENSQAEVSEQRSGSVAAPNSRPGYELVETVEATQDLAEQLSSLCARFCGSGRRWLPGRPRSAARRRPANQRMVIRKESQKYQMQTIKYYKLLIRFPDNTFYIFFLFHTFLITFIQ
jgi:hypothetical protein